MAKIVVQFNRSDKDQQLNKYINVVNEIKIGMEIDAKLKLLKDAICPILNKNTTEKMLVIFHDKHVGKSAIYINEFQDNENVFKKKTVTPFEIMERFLKRLNIFHLGEEYGYVRVFGSQLYDEYYRLLSLDEEYGIPKQKLEDDSRGVYLRQKDRVIYSDLYKRMVDKAQIYSARKSIYVRNRLSHTVEVASISEAIVNIINNKIQGEKKINLDLTRTIAYAHDIGHTPFGHEGERAIEDFLKNQETDFKYFKHNYNGLRVLTYIEESYNDYYGINVLPEVCAGVLGHTSLSKKHKSQNLKIEEVKEYILEYFNYYRDYLDNYGEKIFNLVDLKNGHFVCKFVEGQIVAMADEIAQKGHDFEDAILAKIVSITDVIHYLEPYADNSRKEKNKVAVALYEEIRELESYTSTKVAAKKITSIIIHHLVEDLAKNFNEEIIDESEENEYCLVKKGSIEFSDDAKKVIELFNSITYAKIICSKEVVSYDQHGARIIKGLLELFVNDIRLLPKDVLRRLNVQLYKQNKECVIDFNVIEEKDIEFIKKEMKDRNSIYNKIILREIVDYVSSLTDSYAEKVYEEISKVKLSVY